MSTELLTPREVAEAVGCSPQTVWRWINRGQLAAVRLPSGRWRIAVDELVELQRHERTPATAKHGAFQSDRRPS